MLSFVRQNDQQRVFAVFNLSDESHQVSFNLQLHHGVYTDYFSQQPQSFTGETRIELAAWSYRVFVAER